MYLYPDLEDISLFADDATAHRSSKCTQIITQILQNVATSGNKWCEDNKMQLSIIKTKGALVGSKQRINRITDSDKQIKIIIIDIPIKQFSHSKLLGIHIDESLTWNLHVTKIKKTVAYKLFLLKRILPFLPTQSRIMFFNYYIKPYSEYCCSIWGSTSQEKINIVVKLQKRAARLILDADYLIQSKLLFSELKWVPFLKIVKFHQLSLFFKCINTIVPTYLHNMFRPKSNDHTYLLRSSGTG